MRRAVLIALGISIVCAWPVLAFHDQGVADCSGCHTMHNSKDGAPLNASGPYDWLLLDAKPSDVCLGCHAEGLGAVLVPDPLAPSTERGGGNFTFLLEDNINDGHGGASEPILGYEAGHNIDAPSKGVAPDPVISTSPGGAFSASNMSCTSCHDPHGNASFRLLNGVGAIQDGLFTFTRPAPDAVGLSLFGAGESNTNHTAYKSGMSNWCGNCHGDFHASGELIHPSGASIGGTIAAVYNAYNGTSAQTGGSAATAYLAAVPFEDAANTTSSTAGPSGSSKVSCITCHRAHATSSPNAGRWDFNVPGLAEDGHESGSYPIPNPYDEFQRSLCNKCHNKDAGDALVDFTPTPRMGS
jgi:hypothetical protein